jgi:hypothetical protein
LIELKANEQHEIGCGLATRRLAGAACPTARVERAPFSRKLIACALLIRNAELEFIAGARVAARLIPARPLEIHHRRPIRNRNRQMGTNDDGSYHDHHPPAGNRAHHILARGQENAFPIAGI